MFSTIFAWLFAFLLTLAPVAHAPSAPHYAPPGPTAPAPAVAPSSDPDVSGATRVIEPPAPAPDSVQEQEPSEVIGRQVDGPDGVVCVVVDADLRVVCPPAG